MDESTYAVIASKLGLSTNFIIKDHYLMRLLQYISMYTNKELILTGGTAINKVYLKEKARFSEDADFELTFKIGINELIALVDRVIAKADDFFGVEKRLLKVYYQTDLKYKQPGIEDKVRLDIAFNEIAPKRSEFSQIEITSPFSSERAYGLNVYSLEELLARKLYAVYRRTEGKDLYDIFYSLGLADKKKFYQTSTRFFEYKKLDLVSVLPAIEEKLRTLKHSYIAPRVNNYIPLGLRPNNWEIVANSIADYIHNL